jgi:hypothetical protein
MNTETKPRTCAELLADLSALADEQAKRERMFAQGAVTIFEAIYGEVGPRLRADLVDRFERLQAQADTDALRDLARY